MTRLSVLIDVTRCSGCHNCFMACRDEHYGNDYAGYSAAQPLQGQFWMQLNEIERGAYPRPKLDYVPIPCQHCADAPCMEVAQEGAVYRRDDGIVVIDPVKAEGQRQIVEACPYRVVFWNAKLEIPQKCAMCAHRLDAGEKQPRCSEACPTGAMVFGDLDDPQSEISQRVAALETEVLHPEYGCSPLLVYHGIPRRFVAGEVVLDDADDACAKGVEVALEGEGVRAETTSDVFGQFEFEGLAKNAAYHITITHPGYAPWQVDVKTQTDIDLGDIVLRAT
jgi:Fe-S-cluster-containing dehydrogenase component